MGYNIEYRGRFEFSKTIDDGVYEYLRDFAKTRHMKREMSKSEGYGVYGEFYLAPNEFYQDITFLNLIKEGKDPSNYLQKEYRILDQNNPPPTQPGLWCHWIPTEDHKGLEWNRSEKFYNGKEWLEYLIKNFIAPRGYFLNGSVQVVDLDKREYPNQICELNVIQNEVKVVF